MRKFLSIVLVLLMMFTMVACGGQDTMPQEEAQPPQPPVEEDVGEVSGAETLEEESTGEVQPPSSTTTEVAIDVSNEVLTLTITGQVAEEFWYGYHQANNGEGAGPLLKSSLNTSTAGAYFDLTYMGVDDVVASDEVGEYTGEYTFTETAITFSTPIADLPEEHGASPDESKRSPFDYTAIEEYWIWCMGDMNGDEEALELSFALADMNVSGDIPSTSSADAGDTEEVTNASLDLTDDSFTFTIEGFAVEEFFRMKELEPDTASFSVTMQLDATFDDGSMMNRPFFFHAYVNGNTGEFITEPLATITDNRKMVFTMTMNEFITELDDGVESVDFSTVGDILFSGQAYGMQFSGEVLAEDLVITGMD